MLDEAEKIAKKLGLEYFEAWTRDDKWVNRWYERNNFKNVQSYLQVFINGGEELTGFLKSEIEGLHPIQTFAHYVGNEKEKIKRSFERVHECICYDKQLS